MSSTAKIKNNKASKIHWRLIAIVTVGLLVAWLIFDLLIGGNIRLYTKWIACGQKPVAAMGTGVDAFNVDPNFELNVRVPYHFTPRTIGVIQPSHLFCTPLQAEEAGYSASPSQYEFPAIDKYNASHLGHEVHPEQP